MANVLRRLAPLVESKRFLALLLAPVLLVTGVTLFSYRVASRSEASFGWVEHTYTVIGNLDAELRSLQETEAAVCGYVLTGREDYLHPYQNALEDVPRTLESIRDLTRDNPVQQANVNKLEELTRQELSLVKQTLDLRRGDGLHAAVDCIAAGGGKKLMDQIRELMIDMKDEELSLLDIRQNQSRQYRFWVQMSCIGFFTANLCVFAGMLYLIMRLGRMHNLVKVCAWSKRVEYQGKWMRFEEYLFTRFGLNTTHGISSEAAEQMKAELERLKSGTKI